KNFIDAFGYDYCTAPGEAEAELAALNHLGFIDGILTDDSDAFLFGAQTVIRNFTAKSQELVFTEAASVFVHDAVKLSRPDMIFMALLMGGDYENGLPGFGQRVAHGLARYRFGETLCRAIREISRENIADFLSGWRSDIRQALSTDDQNLLGRRYHQLAQQIPDTFPNLDIVEMYAHPATSAWEDFEMGTPVRPDIAELGRLCERYFSWGSTEGIIQHFGSCLIPGIVTRVLINRAINRDKLRQLKEPIETLICVEHVRHRGSAEPRTVYFTVSDTGFISLATSALPNQRSSSPAKSAMVNTFPARVAIHPAIVRDGDEVDRHQGDGLAMRAAPRSSTGRLRKARQDKQSPPARSLTQTTHPTSRSAIMEHSTEPVKRPGRGSCACTERGTFVYAEETHGLARRLCK
ncbi:hypothetical protein EVJ58_g10971, partial [Rhodofomes roseus]